MTGSARFRETRPAAGVPPAPRDRLRWAAIPLIAVLLSACVGPGAGPGSQGSSGVPSGSAPITAGSSPARPSGAIPTGPAGAAPTGPAGAAPTRPAATPADPVPVPVPTPTPPPTTDQLIGELESATRAANRLAALQALAQLTDPKVGPAIERALGDPDPGVRAAAARILGDRRDPHAVKALATTLGTEMRAEPTSEFVAAASEALGRLGGSGGVAALILVIRGPAGAGRKAAFAALGRIGAPAVAPLQKLLSNADVDVRMAGVDGLFALGAPGVKPLVAALQNSERQVASHAANRLGYLHDTSAEAGLVAVLAKGWWKTASIALARINEATPTRLVKYLGSKKTLRVYHGLIYIGAATTEKALATSLLKLGNLEMAEAFLNCGSETLEQAAHDWAAAHGYRVVTVPGSGGGTWGSGLPD